MKEFFLFMLIVIICATSIWAVCLVIEFIVGVPKQLKRIADALEWRNKNGK